VAERMALILQILDSRLSVRLSVTLRYCVETVVCIIKLYNLLVTSTFLHDITDAIANSSDQCYSHCGVKYKKAMLSQGNRAMPL